ncbi:MAG: hypothetical protein MUC72_05940 [Acidobacteria bacterium]|jgi:hypothetical protein|nr:hypothetical protein [Acidobacteriota bacterium]
MTVRLIVPLCLLLGSAVVTAQRSTAPAPVPQPVTPGPLQKIKIVANTRLNVPAGCTHGFFLDNDLLVFAIADGEARDEMPLNKYIVCNRRGEVVREYEKVLFWDGGPLMLKVNALNTLLLIDLGTGDQQIIEIDYPAISAFSFNPFSHSFIYALGWQNQIMEYDYESRTSRVLAKLSSGNFLLMSQVSPNEIIYARAKISAYYKMFEDDPYISVQVPLFLINLKHYKEAELTKISRTGILMHFDQDRKELQFIVEERGFLKVLRSGDLKHPRMIRISQLNHYDERWFEGVILHYSEMHPGSGLLACSRLRLNYKGDPKKNKFEIFNLRSKNFAVAGGEIHLLDMQGHCRQLTDSKDKTEVVCDWNPDGDEILYRDDRSGDFYVMELDLKGEFGKKALEIDQKTTIQIRP